MTSQVQTASRTQLHAEIAEHRQELAATVDALAQRLDVRARLQAQVTAQRARLRRVAAPAAGGAAVLVAAVIVLRRRSRA